MSGDLTLSEVGTYDTAVIIPADGTVINQASLAGIVQPLADRTLYLKNKLNASPYHVQYSGPDDPGTLLASYNYTNPINLVVNISDVGLIPGDAVDIIGNLMVDGAQHRRVFDIANGGGLSNPCGVKIQTLLWNQYGVPTTGFGYVPMSADYGDLWCQPVTDTGYNNAAFQPNYNDWGLSGVQNSIPNGIGLIPVGVQMNLGSSPNYLAAFKIPFYARQTVPSSFVGTSLDLNFVVTPWGACSGYIHRPTISIKLTH